MIKNHLGILGAAFLFLNLGFIKTQEAVAVEIATTHAEEILPRSIIPYDRENIKETINGEAPSLAVDGSKVYMSYANGDSIFCTYSPDKGQTFSAPVLVAVLRGLVNGGGRGPQIQAAKGQVLIAAPDTSGNFYTWLKSGTAGNWRKGSRINDVSGFAKECFLSLGSNSNGHFFATWLDLRNGDKNNIYGARSLDKGNTWQKNKLIYKSPGGSVCDCCKPSVAMKDQQVAIMFRNNLMGNRDMYLVQSKDGGATFGTAQKLGASSWKLDGCPMDGGGLMIDNDKTVRTVWRREGNVYSCQQGRNEILVGKGKQAVIAGMNGSYFITYISEGRLYCRKPGGQLVLLGQGASYPKLIAVDKSTMLFAWEFEKKIHKAVLHI